MKTIKINDYEIAVNRKTEKIKNIVELYNQGDMESFEEFYPKYKGYNGNWEKLPCNEWVYSLRGAVLDAMKNMNGEELKPVVMEKHHCILGFTVEFENKKYLLTFSNYGNEDYCIELKN